MSKSIYKHCIRRWKVRTKNWSTPHWPEPFKSKYIRHAGLTTADSFIDEECHDIDGWSPELANYIDENRKRLIKQSVLNLRNISTSEIDDSIDDEISCWGD